MKAIILCAGQSLRTRPLTENRPKPMLKILNKMALEYSIDAVKDHVDEIILIVKYKKEMIEEFVKTLAVKGVKIRLIEQKETLGTGHAVLQAKDIMKGRFIVMNGDDLFSKEDVKNCVKNDLCVLAKEVEDAEKYGVIVSVKDKLMDLIEKPDAKEMKKINSKLVNTGLYVLDDKIFDILAKIKKSKRGEIELTDAVLLLSKKNDVHVCKVKDYWLPISYPWQLLNASEFLISRIKTKIDGKVEKGVSVKGELAIGKGTVIKSGTYIEGPVIIGEDCEIGPNCYLRKGTVLGNNCKVGQSCEVKNSIVMDGTKIPHLSYVGDSIIGEKCNLGAGTIIANLRHDHGNVRMKVNNELVDTGRRKLGAIIGDDVHTGIHTSIFPGRKIHPKKSTNPGEIVDKDID